MKIRGAEAVIKSLKAEKTHLIFGYPGGAIMPIYDALYDYKDEIEHILVRHEQGAIHAAQGFARSSGNVGVCFATSGPGATNLITGLADAMIDSTPLVCITGQVASHLLGTDAFQETDVIGISMPVTKWNVQVTRAEDIADAISKAFFIAKSGRPGPVLVDITKDAQFGMVDFVYNETERMRSYKPNPVLDTDALNKALEILKTAERPLMLVGQGIKLSNAEQALQEFVEKSNIPVASTLLGLGALSTQHKNYVGYLGMHGNYAPNVLTNEADVILAVGMRFDDRVTGDVKSYARKAKVLHIDIDASELNKIIPAKVAIHADAREALEYMSKYVKFNEYSEWYQKFNELMHVEKSEVIDHVIQPKEGELTMTEVVNLLSEKTRGEAVIVTDVGQHQMISSRYYKYAGHRNNITSGGLGTMGFGLPAAIGAKLGAPQKTVIAIIGDGGFQMTVQELGTIMQSNIPVKILILNNNFLGMVRQWQQLFFDKRYSFTEMSNPNFVALAQAYSVEAHKVEKRESLSKALDAFLNHESAYLLEVVVAKEENVFPMVETGASVSDIRLK